MSIDDEKSSVPFMPNDQYYRLEALKLSRDIAVGNEAPAITLDRAQKFYEFLYK